MDYIINITDWASSKEDLSQIRRKVFIEEQQVPEELEWDEYDDSAIHILATDNKNQAVATARMQADGHIGRMAVRNEHRHHGIGTAMLITLIDLARAKKMTSLYLHAQITAIPFYEQQGFITISDEFMDAGIPHKTMQLQL